MPLVCFVVLSRRTLGGGDGGEGVGAGVYVRGVECDCEGVCFVCFEKKKNWRVLSVRHDCITLLRPTLPMCPLVAMGWLLGTGC